MSGLNYRLNLKGLKPSGRQAQKQRKYWWHEVHD